MIEKFAVEYFNGQKQVGDDFRSQQIGQWYKEEEDAYSTLIEHELLGYLFENYSRLKKLIVEVRITERP